MQAKTLKRFDRVFPCYKKSGSKRKKNGSKNTLKHLLKNVSVTYTIPVPKSSKQNFTKPTLKYLNFNYPVLESDFKT
jgi:hypothetical protein